MGSPTQNTALGRYHRWVALLWSYFECIGFAGLIYGWSSLVFVLKDEGFYLGLCGDQVGKSTFNNNSSRLANQTGQDVSDMAVHPCGPQDSMLYLVFTVGVSLLGVGLCAVGMVSLKFGIRGIRLIIFFLFLVGSLCVAFASRETPWLLFPGVLLLGISGNTLMVTNFQVSYLFPVWGSVVVGIISGALDSSSIIQLLVKVGYENGVSRSTSYFILAGVHLLTLVNTFFLLPKDHNEKTEELEIKENTPTPPEETGEEKANTGNDDATRMSLLDGGENGNPCEVGQFSSLRKCLISSEFILHVLWVSLLQVRFYFYISSLNSVLEGMLDTQNEVSEYTNTFMYVLVCGGVLSPLAGCVLDLMVKVFKGKPSQLSRQLMPCAGSLSLASLMSVLLSVSSLFTRPSTIYLEFVLVIFSRSFLYMNVAAFMKKVLPSKYFTSAIAVLTFVSGLLCLIQYPLFMWAENHSFYQVNIFLVFLTLFSFIHPGYLWVRSRRADNATSQQ